MTRSLVKAAKSRAQATPHDVAGEGFAWDTTGLGFKYGQHEVSSVINEKRKEYILLKWTESRGRKAIVRPDMNDKLQSPADPRKANSLLWANHSLHRRSTRKLESETRLKSTSSDAKVGGINYVSMLAELPAASTPTHPRIALRRRMTLKVFD
ncbi:hypothetical protein EVAR_62341_1 [Eumeta japonica]|uniref:Uncharacterized protein n=1 Tax=Eumeta variegata TaxID=151549 RepID=A0A4C1ZQR7_EUMVA|nr:hypothetical protein EVAR_62341_1 [Eumeta japonica]